MPRPPRRHCLEQGPQTALVASQCRRPDRDGQRVIGPEISRGESAKVADLRRAGTGGYRQRGRRLPLINVIAKWPGNLPKREDLGAPTAFRPRPKGSAI